MSHTVVPFKLRVEAEGVENPVYNVEDVCVLCEVGTEVKETVELEHVGLFRTKEWGSAYILWQPLVRRSRDWPAGISPLDMEPLASQAKLCPRSQLRVS